MKSSPLEKAPAAEKAGAKIYTPITLAVYDLWVLRFSNHLAWRHPTREMLGLYNAHLSADHLDIGPGTGWYLREAIFPSATPTVTLFDLNPNPLAVTSRRLRRSGINPATHLGSVLEPLGLRQFDSVAANFLMHCVPGSWSQKSIAFRHIANVTSVQGVFFGSSILTQGVPTNFLGRALARVYNSIGTFHNATDDFDGLKEALLESFSDVDITVHGSVATWSARSPRR